MTTRSIIVAAAVLAVLATPALADIIIIPEPITFDAWYTIWADNYQQPVTLANHVADVNWDLRITDADYTIWADNYRHDYGYTTFGGGDTGTAIVPEPATLSLLTVGVLGLLRRRRT